MNIKTFTVEEQAYGAFNNGEIVENKPIGFPREGGSLKPYSNLFYWANAKANVDSTIGLHPHKGFEIMSFVLDGTIKHFDTKGNIWKDLTAGDVQIIRAGSGISHAEHMTKGSRMFQIWLDPDLNKTLQQDASYDDYQASSFPSSSNDNYEQQVLIGESSPIKLDSPGVKVIRVKIYNSKYSLDIGVDHVASVYVLDGKFELAKSTLSKDNFATIDDCDQIDIEGVGEIFVFITPLRPTYQTYVESMI